MSNLPQKVYNVSGDYVITCANGAGDFTVNAANILFNGNVTQIANSTTVSNFITVAANNTGVITDMGLLAQINANAFAGLRYDAIANTWQISSSVTSTGAPIAPYLTLYAGNLKAGGANTQVQFNYEGEFGATAGLAFDYANNVLTLQGTQVLGNIGNTTPATPTNAVAMYNSTVGAGQTGVYVLSTEVDDELISRTQALRYAIIF